MQIFLVYIKTIINTSHYALPSSKHCQVISNTQNTPHIKQPLILNIEQKKIP